jgi:hypothetical protein
VDATEPLFCFLASGTPSSDPLSPSELARRFVVVRGMVAGEQSHRIHTGSRGNWAEAER